MPIVVGYIIGSLIGQFIVLTIRLTSCIVRHSTAALTASAHRL